MIASGIICGIYVLCAIVLFCGVREQKGTLVVFFFTLLSIFF